MLYWRPRSHRTLQLHYISAVVEWQMNSLAFIQYNGEQKKTGEPQHCLAWGIHIVLLHNNVFHHRSTSIWLAYIPACILSHIGPLWEFNSAVILMVGSPHLTHYTTPSKHFIIIVTLGAHVGPQTFPRRTSPGRTQLQLVHFFGMYACIYCDICACILIMLCDCLAHWPACASSWQPCSA